MGEGGQVLDVGGRISGMRGNCGRPPLPTKFVEQISFQEIEEREVEYVFHQRYTFYFLNFQFTFRNFL